MNDIDTSEVQFPKAKDACTFGFIMLISNRKLRLPCYKNLTCTSFAGVNTALKNSRLSKS